jgi:hypothetical protein
MGALIDLMSAYKCGPWCALFRNKVLALWTPRSRSVKHFLPQKCRALRELVQGWKSKSAGHPRLNTWLAAFCFSLYVIGSRGRGAMDNPPDHTTRVWTALRVRGLTTAGTAASRAQPYGLHTAQSAATNFLFFLGNNSRGARTRSERGARSAMGGRGATAPPLGGMSTPPLGGYCFCFCYPNGVRWSPSSCEILLAPGQKKTLGSVYYPAFQVKLS